MLFIGAVSFLPRELSSLGNARGTKSHLSDANTIFAGHWTLAVLVLAVRNTKQSINLVVWV
jgi:hypothetical protein